MDPLSVVSLYQTKPVNQLVEFPKSTWPVIMSHCGSIITQAKGLHDFSSGFDNPVMKLGMLYNCQAMVWPSTWHWDQKLIQNKYRFGHESCWYNNMQPWCIRYGITLMEMLSFTHIYLHNQKLNAPKPLTWIYMRIEMGRFLLCKKWFRLTFHLPPKRTSSVH